MFEASSTLLTALAAPSVVFCQYAHTCSLHHGRVYEGSNHALMGKIRRDHRGPW